MYCTICGKSIDDTSTMCPYCNSLQTPIVTIENDYNSNLANLQNFSHKVGKAIGKGIGISIGLGIDITRGIREGIVNEINKKV
jgi:RNA polymerase subunit RPABC4/transcription elongation factor Spt4